MNKNLKYIFLLAATVFLLVSITAISAQDTNSTDTDVTKTTTYVSAAKVTETKEVETAAKNIVKKENNYTNTKKETQTHIVNNENVDEIFGGQDYTLNDNIKPGDTLDFQGTIDKNHSIVINKPINTLSSTEDAVIYLHTISGSLMGEDPGNSFVVNNGGSNSNITGLYINNTEFWVHNVYNTVFRNVTIHTADVRVGGGVGVASLRYSNNITMDQCTFYVANNGGSSTFVWTGCNNCTIENSYLEGEGNIGNLIYVGNSHNAADAPEGYINTNYDNIVRNCTINTTSSGGISIPVQNMGYYTIIEDNSFHARGSTIGTGTNGTLRNNKLYGGVGISSSANSTVYSNTIYGTGATTINANSTVYNNTLYTTTIAQANVTFTNNNITGALILNNAANITGNNINTMTITQTNARNSNITHNNITGGIYATISNLTISDNIFNCTNNETVLTLTGANNTVTDNLIYAKSTTGTDAISVPDTTILENNLPEMKEAVTITDETYSEFFDENSVFNTSKAENYGTIILDGNFYNKTFKFEDIILNVNGNEAEIYNGSIILEETARITVENIIITNNEEIENAIIINGNENTIRNVSINKIYENETNSRAIVVYGDSNLIENNTIYTLGVSQPIDYTVFPNISPITGILVMSNDNIIRSNTIIFEDHATDGYGSTDMITLSGALGEITNNIVVNNTINANSTGYIYAINLGVNANNNNISYNNININSTFYAYGVQILEVPVTDNIITYNKINLNATSTAYGVFANPWSMSADSVFKNFAVNYNNINIEAYDGFGIQFTGSDYGDIMMENVNFTYNNISVTGKYALGMGLYKFDNVYLFRNNFNIKGETNETDYGSWDYVKPVTTAIYAENGNYIRASYQFPVVENGSSIIFKNIENSSVSSGSMSSNNINIIVEDVSNTNITSNTLNSTEEEYGIIVINSDSILIRSNTFNTVSEFGGNERIIVDENSENITILSNTPASGQLSFITTEAAINENLEIIVNVTTSTGAVMATGAVEFTDEEGNVLATVDVVSGKATLEYGLVTSFDPIIINAQYTGTGSYIKSPIVTAQIEVIGNSTVEPLPSDLVLGETTYLSAFFCDDGKIVPEGKAIFRINGKTLRDDNGNVIYADINNGFATLQNITVTSEWMMPDTTIEAIFTGNNEFEPIFTEKQTVNVTKPEATIEIISENEIKAGDKITLTATVTYNGENINTGRVAFKLNGKSLKGDDSKVLYADVVNGTAKIEYTIPAKTKAQNYTLSAVFTDSKYLRSENEKNITVSK